ncbi:hypothetical protein [Lyngbya sp. CCY1209]|jgi:hypothetical protein|uniref:hypothetical protein n=1 Tax=Lyngbya sp. CCY1209 TaxID=2886103 RepID=UPI002D210A45|nr:hypothetical protein [Lyngbya sp. CCY1209]MEB3883726.1 hypothetical protein [Lyngbya sp. CCY1209]
MARSSNDKIRYDSIQMEGNKIHIQLDVASNNSRRRQEDDTSEEWGNIGFLFLLLALLVVFVGSYGGPGMYSPSDINLPQIFPESNSDF